MATNNNRRAAAPGRTVGAYGAALVTIAIATAIRYLLGPLLGSNAPFSTYYVAVVVGAWYGGLGPAILTVLLGALLGCWLFIPPPDTIMLSNVADFWGLVLYLFAGATISLFSNAHRRAQRDAVNLAARESEQQQTLHRVLNEMADGFAVFDREWRYVFVNDRMLDLTRRAREQLLGRIVWELFPEHIGHVSYIAMHESLRDQRPTTFETHFAPSDTWLSCRVYPSTEGVTVYVTDATERKHALQARDEAEGLNRAILAAAMDGIITIDQRGMIESFNPAAERLFGYPALEVIGENIEMLMPEPFRTEHENYLKEYQRTGQRKVIGIGRQVVGKRKDGSTFPFDLSVSEMQIGGRRLFTGLVHDATERMLLEQEREKILANERAARSAAELANRTKDEFLATLSHELRTPLNSILGWTQMLRVGPVTGPDLKQGLETIERNARLQAQLIEDLLDMSRITSGRMRLDVQTVDLDEIITSAIESVGPAAIAKQIRIERSPAGELPSARGDPSRLHQIVWNLLSNAIKFTPRGGRVQIAAEAVDGQVELRVSDSGIGMTPEFMQHLFQRFSQADTSTTRRFGGLGLGLAIVRHLTELHGGTVHAASEGDGRGSTFTICLPFAVANEMAPAEKPAAPPEATSVAVDADLTLRGIRILVVDDEADTRILMQRFLRQFDADVQTVASVAEALASVRANPPDVLISDIGMPGEDGYSLIRQVRALGPDNGGRVPALALTAFARPEDRNRALDCGYQAHLSKPVEPMELIASVAALSGRKSG